MTEATCNQCHEEMKPLYYNQVIGENIETWEKKEEHVCTAPECPSYGLLQIPMERMP